MLSLNQTTRMSGMQVDTTVRAIQRMARDEKTDHEMGVERDRGPTLRFAKMPRFSSANGRQRAANWQARRAQQAQPAEQPQQADRAKAVSQVQHIC